MKDVMLVMHLFATNAEPQPRMSSRDWVRIDVLERADTYVVAVWRRLMLLVWYDNANQRGIERSRLLFDTWSAAHPGDAAFLIVLPAHRTRVPDKDMVHAMARTANSPVSHCKGMATLIQSEGFVAASIRAIMMRIHSIAARNDPPLVFGTLTKAASWAAALLDDPEITSTLLGEAISVAREGE